MNDQKAKAKQLEVDTEYLMHVLRNSVVCIEGCFKQIEVLCRDMTKALEGFKTCLQEREEKNEG